MLPSAEFFDPEQLIRHLAEVIGDSAGIPPGLSEVVAFAYHLSLYAEETRPLRFSIAYSEEKESLPAAKSIVPRRHLDLESLRHVAPACEPARTCMTVEYDHREAKPVLTGLAARPDLLGMLPARPWSVVLIDVDGPARLSLTVRDIVVRFDRHHYARVDGPQQVGEMLPPTIRDAVASHCTTPTSLGLCLRLGNSVLAYNKAEFEAHKGEMAEEARVVANRAVGDTVYEILKLLQADEHGATLVLTDLAAPNSASSLPTALLQHAFWFSCETGRPVQADPWNCGLLDYVGWRIHAGLARKGVTVLADLEKDSDGLLKWADSIARIRLQASMSCWENDIKMCARLAAIDGAVLFNVLLEPCAFGCKFNVPRPDDLPPAVQAFLVSRGLRHRSAAAAIHSLTGAVGFVVSQDGPITMFRNSDPAPLSFREIRI